VAAGPSLASAVLMILALTVLWLIFDVIDQLTK
jgi:hypothetical protein